MAAMVVPPAPLMSALVVSPAPLMAAQVPPVVAETIEERHSFALAAERKALRIKKQALFLAASEAPSSELPAAGDTPKGASEGGAGGAGGLPGAVVAPCSECVTELVLPHCANHHGHTFGG